MMEEDIIKEICKKLPCRDKIVIELVDLIGDPNESFPNSIYLYGHTGTGKSVLVNNILENCQSTTIALNCIECYSSKILYETILNTFKYNNTEINVKCEIIQDFLNEMKSLDDNKSYIICLDNAERIRNMDANILPIFVRLQELTGLNICVIMLSQLPFEKYFTKTGFSEVINIHCPEYTKNDVQTILYKDFSKVIDFLKMKLKSKSESLDPNEYKIRFKILDELNADFYDNYLNIFLNVFFRACRDLPELQIISRDCFHLYCEPVLNRSVDPNDISKLWRLISGTLKIALSAVYMRIDHSLSANQLQQQTEHKPWEITQDTKRLAQSLEIPYYAKFLLIASFLASHNAAKEDKRLFVKHSGKSKKRLQNINANAKVHEKMSVSLGPKSFTIDRLLAIFYAILDDKVGLTCNLLAQISSLVNLKFLAFVSGENNVIDGSAKLHCTVGLDFIIHIGKVVGFNVRQYLCDFM